MNRILREAPARWVASLFGAGCRRERLWALLPMTLLLVACSSGNASGPTEDLVAEDRLGETAVPLLDSAGGELQDDQAGRREVWDLDFVPADLDASDSGLVDTDLPDADVTDADVTDADVTDADVTDADVTDADVTDADVTDADVTDADVTDADVTDADVTDADLVEDSEIVDVPPEDIKPDESGCIEDICGDGVCSMSENCFFCPEDCGECCGNGWCEDHFGENCAICLQDCPCSCGEACVEGACIFSMCLSRECGPDGCGGTCGTCDSLHICTDGLCVYEPACDNGICDPDETCFTCPQDCGVCCGNDVCEPDYGEDCDICPEDCGCTECGFECVNAVCTFTACDGRECGPDGCGGGCGICLDHYTCSESGMCEYVPWCGDGTCDSNEDCEFCSEDCGQCGMECPPDMAMVDDSFCMDIYEASRPDATAFSVGTETTHATSRPGVMPWGGTSPALQVLYATGKAACEAAGKRLCTEAEMHLACGGKSDRPYVYGSSYVADACNGIDAYCNCSIAPCDGYGECPYPHCRLYSPEGIYGYGCGSAFRIAVTGAFPQCVNEWGIYDLNGNVWELMDSGNNESWYKGGAFNCGNSEFLHQCGLKYSSTQVNALGFRCCK